MNIEKEPDLVRTITVPGDFTLELTRDELKTFHLVFQRVGGSPTDSPRKAVEEFNRMIESKFPDIHTELYARRGIDRFFSMPSGSIYFNDGSIND